MNRLREHWPLLPVLLLYVAPRVWRATCPYFFEFDEYFYFHWARFGWQDMREALRIDVWPPLGPLALRLAIRAGDFALLPPRLLTIAIGAGGMLAGYAFLRREFSTRAALLFAALLAVSPTDITWSTLARGYSLFAALMLVHAICFYSAARRESRLAWIGVALTSIALLYTHYLAAFLLLAMYAMQTVLAWRQNRTGDIGRIFLCGVVLIAAFAPYAPTFLNQIECRRHMMLAAFYPEQPWHGFIQDALRELAGGTLALGILAGGLIVTLCTRQPSMDAGERAWTHAIGGMYIAAHGIGLAYHYGVGPIFNPGKQAILYVYPVLAAAAVILARCRWRAIPLLMLAALACNSARIMVQTRQLSAAPADQLRLATAVRERLPADSHFYLVSYSCPQAFLTLHPHIARDRQYREFTVFQPDYLDTVVTPFLRQDLAAHPRAGLLLRRGEAADTLIARWQADPELGRYRYTRMDLPPAPDAVLLLIEIRN